MEQNKEIDLTRIGKFISSLNPTEWLYVQQTMGICRSMRALRDTVKMSAEDICTAMKLPADHYDRFMNGDYNYGVDQVAVMQYIYSEHNKNKTAK